MRVNFQGSIDSAANSISNALVRFKHLQAQQKIAENTGTTADAKNEEKAEQTAVESLPEQPAPTPTPEQPQQSALEKAGFQIYGGDGLGKRQWNPVQVEQEALQRLHERTNMVSNIAPKPPTINPARRGAYDDTYVYKVNGGYRRGKKSNLMPSPPTTVTVREEDK